jgi:hypothetical protein
MSESRTVSVCPQCNEAYFHPLSYCWHCPSKLEKRDLPDFPGWRANMEQIHKWLESFGLKDGGC